MTEHPYEIKATRIAPQEKETDVNLAARLIVDGCKGAYQQAALISKDSDFVGAMRAVRNELGLPVVLVNPDCPTRKRCSSPPRGTTLTV